MKFQINGNKIARGNGGEQLKLVYLLNPAAFRVLLRAQGHDAKDLNELEDLIRAKRTGEKNVNFGYIIKHTPISDKILRSAQSRVQIVGGKTKNPVHVNDRHNLDLIS